MSGVAIKCDGVCVEQEVKRENPTAAITNDQVAAADNEVCGPDAGGSLESVEHKRRKFFLVNERAHHDRAVTLSVTRYGSGEAMELAMRKRDAATDEEESVDMGRDFVPRHRVLNCGRWRPVRPIDRDPAVVSRGQLPHGLGNPPTDPPRVTRFRPVSNNYRSAQTDRIPRHTLYRPARLACALSSKLPCDDRRGSIDGRVSLAEAERRHQAAKRWRHPRAKLGLIIGEPDCLDFDAHCRVGIGHKEAQVCVCAPRLTLLEPELGVLELGSYQEVGGSNFGPRSPKFTIKPKLLEEPLARYTVFREFADALDEQGRGHCGVDGWRQELDRDVLEVPRPDFRACGNNAVWLDAGQDACPLSGYAVFRSHFRLL